jgi:IclR family transcriptional regulator, pca regulon regulatory protein
VAQGDHDLVALDADCVAAHSPASIDGAAAGGDPGAGESAALAVPRPGPAMDVVAQADARGLLGASDWVGRRFPLPASAPGKLVLTELDDSELTQWVERVQPERFTPRTITTGRRLRTELARIRAQGYAELHDELEPALASLAATVREAARRSPSSESAVLARASTQRAAAPS